ERLDETVQVCRALFQSTATSPASFDGRYHRLVDAVNVPPSPQPGGPPIMVGGNSERWALPLVARRADMCNFIGDVPTLRRKLATLDDLCRDVGRDPATVTRTNLTTLILADTVAEADQLRQTFAAPEVIVGTEDDVVAAVQERAALGIGSIICNLPSADPLGVAQVGTLLTKALS
ncbi:MAG TPA: LLM class flavin-dependent oxidoreductase, partial [Acidimicrobiales bacterium]|nr:LLM class flavin-dependent oxidoreductase [Acidimicrobiales bacterium]